VGWFGTEIIDRISGSKSRELQRRAAALQRRNLSTRITTTNPDEQGTNTAWSGGGQMSEYVKLESNYAARNADYSQMSMSAQIGLALDVYADEATIPNDAGHVIWTESKDGDLSSMLNEMLHKRITMDRDAWKLVRNLAYRGNVFAEPALYQDLGVVALGWLDALNTRRVETNKGLLQGFVQIPANATGAITPELYAKLRQQADSGYQTAGYTLFADWELVHWRIMGDGLNDLMGTSMLESARWAWKRLHLLEDGAMLHKLTRAASRYAFKVDVGTTPANGVWAYMASVMGRYKRKRYVDSSGKMKFGPGVLSPDDDFAFPIVNGKEMVSVDILSGTDYQDMTPVDYFSGLVFSALKVPKLRIGSGEEIRKDALIGQDVGFARLIMRLQNETISGIDQINNLHLLALGIDTEAVEYQTKMSISSQIFELARMELQSARADLMQRWSGFASPKWILTNIAKLPEDQAEAIYKEMLKSKLEVGAVDAKVAGMQQAAFAPPDQGPAESWHFEPDRRTRADERKLETLLSEGLLSIDRKLTRRARQSEAFFGDLAKRLLKAK
jgi:hypothetical protein